MTRTASEQVVIVGGGFGGLMAARSLRRTPVRVTLVDRRNFHLFQPLLYQVATGGLSPGDIASPLRHVLKYQKNATVLLAEVTGFDLEKRNVLLRGGERLDFDYLIVAAGVSHDYFGHDGWGRIAPGLKSVEDAIDIRTRIFLAFEKAERAVDSEEQEELLTFVVVGGGPTGVELAGALGEIARETLRHDFRRINPGDARILLVEGASRILTSYPELLSRKAQRSLERLGVTVLTNTLVTSVNERSVDIKAGDNIRSVPAQTVLWAAGVRGSGLGGILVGNGRSGMDRAGRVLVNPDLSLPDFPGVFVIGDLAVVNNPGSKPLPGVAPVAMQQGRYVARVIDRTVRRKSPPAPFRYRNYGSMATIGRAAAVADFGWLRLSGYPAWLAWLFVHLMKLVEFENRVLVFIQWAWNYVTKNRGARLITSEHRSSDR
ncbi:FAD-dependent oxidoreductase [candidate division GN15 bacterium]|uniref:NADH:ubiquinone reductase (non-electrogenic) n=1 Tax=candidate division GN15 bacterium TaxID=2072418 RepID=A0A855X783_9BACT|nr:MAG: FAD-dependent oxidoreductase [candidate division GN15 bacterium]